MEIANLVLEYLRVILSWPPLVIAALICFLVSQREPITRLIDRIRGLSFPGGELNAEPYEPPLEKKSGEPAALPEKSTSTSSGEIDREFTYFLNSSLKANRQIISKLIDVLWDKLGLSMFNREVKKIEEKMDRIKDRIDENAYRDLLSVMNKDDQPPKRLDLINSYIKSKSLIDYLRSLATKR